MDAGKIALILIGLYVLFLAVRGFLNVRAR